ncbi:MAG: phosphohydrolase [Phenylobacterium sp.]|nr:phosphohydrolase [Phenylobacterium sp.]
MDRAQACACWLDSGPPSPGDGLAGETKARLRAAYAEPHRRYHDMTHIADCLAELAAIEGLDEARRLRLAYAIWWHDVVYDPTRSDNEAASAAQAGRDLAALGEDAATCAEVARLIELTTGHQVGDDDLEGALLVSIDLAVLGRAPEAYDVYARAIRQEYSHVPEAFFRPGRAAVLKRILDARPLYPDPAFRARLEDQARANLSREITNLR